MTAPAGHRLGLLLIVLCFVMGMISRGLGDSFAVFVLPISQSFGVDRASVTGIYALSMLGIGFGGPLAGLLVDRFGPRQLVLAGVAAMGLGMGLSALAQAVWQFYPTFGLLVGIGCAALGSVMQSALLGRWFSRRLGTALAAAYSANGVGLMVMAPLAQYLIEAQGWRFAYAVLGGSVLLLLLPILLLPWRQIEAGHPDLRMPARGDNGEIVAAPDLRAAIRTAPFWNLCCTFCFTSIGIYSLTPQTVAYLIEQGMPPIDAAGAVGVTGLLMPVGMIGFNWLADRGGRRLSAAASYGCTMLGIGALLAFSGPRDFWLLAAFVVLFGISMGSRGPMISTLATLRFRGPHLGRIYGSITLAMGIGGALGAWLGGLAHDLTDGYTAVMAVSLAGLAIGAIPLLVEAQRQNRIDRQRS
ncbi:MAG: MFS transporter [Reyranellaceae bacterium]